MQRSQSNRVWEVIIGLFLIIAGVTGLGSEAPPAMLVILLGLFLAVRPFRDFVREQGRRLTESNYIPPERVSLQRQSGSEQVYAHALRAVEKAGLDPDEVQVLPVDIGVMAFKGDQDPLVYRTRPVLNDVEDRKSVV